MKSHKEINRQILKNKKQRGSSIVEIVISLFMFLVMLILYGAASNSVVLNRNAKNQGVLAGGDGFATGNNGAGRNSTAVVFNREV